MTLQGRGGISCHSETCLRSCHAWCRRRSANWRKAGSVLQGSLAFATNTSGLWNFRGSVARTYGCLRAGGWKNWKIHSYIVGGAKERARREARLRRGETGQSLVGSRGVQSCFCFCLKRENVYPGGVCISLVCT